MDVIREALNNELGYGVADKYKSFTHELVKAYEEKSDIDQFDLSPSDIPSEDACSKTSTESNS